MADLAERPAAALRSLGELALSAADRYSGDAMRAPGRSPITFADFGRAIREIAGGLASLGINQGDKVAILAGTIPEWPMADFGACVSPGASTYAKRWMSVAHRPCTRMPKSVWMKSPGWMTRSVACEWPRSCPELTLGFWAGAQASS